MAFAETVLKGDTMTVTKKQLDLQKESNRIQGEANTIQRDMVNVIETYNKTTLRHNRLMVFLTIVIIALTFATLWNTFLNQTGRYAISGGKGGLYVLDTKTSRLWQRVAHMNMDFGTNENPTGGLITSKDDPNNK